MKYKLILIVFLLLSMESYAEDPPFPCVDPNDPVCGGQTGLPIDSGIPILLLVGTLFGAYTIYNKKHKIIKKPL